MKKILSMLLVLTMVLGLSVSAFAVSGHAGITGMAPGGLVLGHSGSLELGEVSPQDQRVEYINLYDTMFTWDSNLSTATPTQLTPAQIRSARLDVRATRQNAKVIDSITLNQRESRIEVKFQKEYAATKEIDFDFDVYLTIDGRRQSDYGLNFTGTFGNPIIDLYSNDSSTDLSDGCVAQAMEYIPKLEADIGNGVTIVTRLSKDKRIYGTATRIPDSLDDARMKEYKDISEVLNLQTVGLSSTSSIVKLGVEFHSCYIYGKDLEYLGKGRDELPFSNKYYLSTKKLDIRDDYESGNVSSESVDEPATSSGTDQTFENANHNPATGR